MAQSAELSLADAQATMACGRRLASALLEVRPVTFVLYLDGDLGSGKTTFARGLLQQLGHHGHVPSPTFTLVEPYALAGYRVYHVDLYRIREPVEVAHLGLAEQITDGALALIEWPAHGSGEIPPPDLELCLSWAAQGRSARWRAHSAAGMAVLQRVMQQADTSGS